MSAFKDKVALITGAGAGIGRAAALEFAHRGAKVVVADVTTQGNATVEQIEKMHGHAIFVQVDVSQPAGVQDLIHETMQTYGRLDFAFNNAGIEGASASVADMAVADWHRVIEVNLSGVFYSMKYELPAILKSGGGAIVNMSSILGQVGFTNASAYTASKHGVIGLTKAAALEYSAQGIRVNAVCPAFIATPMLERAGITSDPAVRASMEAMHPIGRLGEAEEVAKVVTWLCSPDASFVTGEAILIDGAYTAR
jgi:NAD(P)-dependent dehydrogenase (short-subunit alcohol dehydrogenase family)